MPRRRESRLRMPLATGLAALVVIAVSVTLVHSRTPADEWEDPPRYAGGAPLMELASVLPSPRLDRPIRVAVVHDPASDHFHGGPERLDSLTALWVSALREIGADARVVHPGALGRGIADVLVVPSTPCLSVETYGAIADAARHGHGLLLTRHTGLRDAGCTSVGAGLLVAVTGAARLDTLEQRDETYVVLPAGSPLAMGIPPGARLELLAGNHVALRRPGRDAYWSTYSLDPAPASGQPLLDAAVVRGDDPRAPAVYWGFELGDVVSRPWSRELSRLLLRNSIAWAAGIPIVEVEPWPNGRRAAAVLAQDVEDEFANARHALDTLRAVGAPATFFLVSEVAREHEPLVRELAQYGEIGTHSENHRLLGGLALELQHRRLERTQEQLRRLTGARVPGLRPPEEQFDAATLAAWGRAGGSYVFANNDGRTASPELMQVDGRSMVLLGRVVNDDFAVVRRAGLAAVDTQASIYLREYEKVRALGGLYMFSYHSNMMARPELVGALGPLARRLAADTGVWLTTAGELADWWRAKSEVRPAVSWNGAHELLVGIQYGGESVLEGVVLGLAVPTGRTASAAEGARILPGRPGIIRLALPPLRPGSTSAIRVRLAPHTP